MPLYISICWYITKISSLFPLVPLGIPIHVTKSCSDAILCGSFSWPSPPSYPHTTDLIILSLTHLIYSCEFFSIQITFYHMYFGFFFWSTNNISITWELFRYAYFVFLPHNCWIKNWRMRPSKPCRWFWQAKKFETLLSKGLALLILYPKCLTQSR